MVQFPKQSLLDSAQSRVYLSELLSISSSQVLKIPTEVITASLGNLLQCSLHPYSNFFAQSLIEIRLLHFVLISILDCAACCSILDH